MKQWYAAELSKLTHVSVRTLHHYDKIGLLKPSMRTHSGYRLYSEKDLLTLQQIIACKFFGFSLAQIKKLLANRVEVLEHFSMQSHYLQEKAETLMEASVILKRLITQCSDKKSIPWEHIIQLIEVYHMTQKLENSWVKEIFNPDELKQYAAFEEDLKKRSTKEAKAQFEKNWLNLVEAVEENLQQDPQSEVGVHLGQQCMDLVNGLYGKENINLRTKIWEQGFQQGKHLSEHGLTPEVVAWLDKAIDAYWRKRIYNVLAQVGTAPSSEVERLWDEVLTDMHGDEAEPKAAVVAASIADSNVSLDAKNWLKKNFSH